MILEKLLLNHEREMNFNFRFELNTLWVWKIWVWVWIFQHSSAGTKGHWFTAAKNLVQVSVPLSTPCRLYLGQEATTQRDGAWV